LTADLVQETPFFLKEFVNQIVLKVILLQKVVAYQKNVDKDRNSMISNNVLIFVELKNNIKVEHAFVLMDFIE
jgi:hypothetical protein